MGLLEGSLIIWIALIIIVAAFLMIAVCLVVFALIACKIVSKRKSSNENMYQ